MARSLSLGTLLWNVAGVLLIIWGVGLLTNRELGGWLHLLPIVATVLMLVATVAWWRSRREVSVVRQVPLLPGRSEGERQS